MVNYHTSINQLIQYSFEIFFKKTDGLNNLNYIIIVQQVHIIFPCKYSFLYKLFI